MTPRHGFRRWIAGAVALALLALPVAEASAQGRRGGSHSRASVSQSHKKPHPPSAHQPVARPPTPPPPAYKPPPPHRPPGYRPPPPRPPHYHRPPPPRYHGHYHRDYWAWRAIAGTAAVIAVGTLLATLPPQSRTVIVSEKTYYVYENVYYERVFYGDQLVYQVVPKP